MEVEELVVSCSLGLKNFVSDLVLPIVQKLFFCYNVYGLWQENNTYWCVASVAIVLMPGLMELLYWTIECWRGTSSNKEICFWTLFFNPFTFHIGVWFWHVFSWISDCRHENHRLQKTFSKSNVFKCLHAIFESAPQVLLQLVIIFITWHGPNLYFYAKIGLLCTDMVILSLTCIDHHIREVSAKTVVPRVRDTLLGFPFYFLTFACRIFLLAVITSYCRWALLAIGVAHLAFNALPIWRILRTDSSKNLWTLAGSLFVPICFVSKDTVKIYRLSLDWYPGEKFQRFYKWNSLIFAFNTTVAMAAIVGLLYQDLLKYNCRELPVFSCSAHCPHREQFCLYSGPQEDNRLILFFGLPLAILLNSISLSLVWLMGRSRVIMGEEAMPES